MKLLAMDLDGTTVNRQDARQHGHRLSHDFLDGLGGHFCRSIVKCLSNPTGTKNAPLSRGIPMFSWREPHRLPR